jgi:hypothetical protein
VNQDENRYAPPKAVVDDIDAATSRFANIDALDVSDKWKQKFRIFEKAGGPKLPRFKELAARERSKITFNILAFLFGPFYYLAKGMWRKALSLSAAVFVAVLVVAIVLILVDLGGLVGALGYGANAIYAARANVDYYKKMVLGDNGWW